ncbi:MAG TPA: DUF2784 domain-containing protein [Desulfomonilia bacterium]|nr:DUF2784 domain-containing protein [Desulfomonilia bacterium]
MTNGLIWQILADGVVLLHLGFIIFVIFGGIFIVFQSKVLWFHIPCVIWGILVELIGFICPLTPLENYMRIHAGRSPYSGDFVIHYIEPVIYPEGLTRELQIVMGLLVILFNFFIYGWLILRKNKY